MSEVSTRDSRFDRSALECPAVELAPALLGCVLVRTLDDGAWIRCAQHANTTATTSRFKAVGGG